LANSVKIKHGNFIKFILSATTPIVGKYQSLFLGGMGLNSGLALAKQALYHLSHTSNPLFSGYFGAEGFGNYLPRLALN
jgi:hypothetical protein